MDETSDEVQAAVLMTLLAMKLAKVLTPQAEKESKGVDLVFITVRLAPESQRNEDDRNIFIGYLFEKEKLVRAPVSVVGDVEQARALAMCVNHFKGVLSRKLKVRTCVRVFDSFDPSNN